MLKKHLLIILFGTFLIFGNRLYALDAKLTIEKEVDSRSYIEVIDIDNHNIGGIGKKVYDIIFADMKISGNMVPQKPQIEEDFSFDLEQNSTKDSNKKEATYTLKYRFRKESNRADLVVKLYKKSTQKPIFKNRYHITVPAKYPFLIHRAISDINSALGFESIEWINRYLLISQYTGKKQSEILITDYTLNYIKRVISGGLNLFPLWGDRDQKSFYYTNFNTGMPVLYRLDLTTGKQNKIISSNGMLVCSDISKDNNRVLLTMAPNGQPDIYEYNLNTKTTKRLTTFSGIDVNGKYADSEQSLVFVSNRLGNPNIFKKSISGGNGVEQLVFGGKDNNSCDTYDKKVVYSSKEDNGEFNIYITSTEGEDSMPLTSTGINQYPRFSADGNIVLYIKRSPKGNLVGYIGLQTKQTLQFDLGLKKIQSIDW